MRGSHLLKMVFLGILAVLGTVAAFAAAPQAEPAQTVSISAEDLAAVLRSGESLNSLIEAFDIPPGGTVVIEFEVAVDNPVPGGTMQVSNQGTVTGVGLSEPTDDPDTPADDDTTITGLLADADLSVTKDDGVTSAVPGQTVFYTIVASNSGPSGVSDAALTDTFPTGFLCTWTSVAAGGASGNTNNAVPAGSLSETLNLPSSSSVTYTVTCSIPADATGTISNTASIASMALNDPDTSNNNATDNNTTLTPQADLGVTKTDGVTSATPGGQVVYTIVATNSGPSEDPAVAMADTFPGVLSCGWTSVVAGGATGNTNNAGPANLADSLDMPVGSSVTYTVTCDIDSGATGTLSNTATVTSSVTDSSSGNNSATDNDTALSPTADIGVTKTDGVVSAAPGGQVVYTIVASNAGPSDDPSVTLTDTFPADLSCGWTSVAAGGATGNTDDVGPADLNETLSLPASSSVTYTVTCDIDSGATGTLSNTATVTSSVTDNNSGNDSATDNDTALSPAADIGVTKTDGVVSAAPGGQVVYTIVASNAGPSDDPSVTVTDTFPADLTCGWTSGAAGGATGNTNNVGPADLNETLSLPAGSSVTYTVTCEIDPGATGTLSNTVTVSGTVPDSNGTNNSATDNDTNLAPTANLSVTKTDGVVAAVPGNQVVYTIEVSNNGPSDDPSVTVTDTFPADLSCGWTSVAAGGATGNTNNGGPANLNDTLNLPADSSVTYTATCDIDPGAVGTLSNTATVSGSVADGNPVNNTATDNDTVLGPAADLQVTKTDGVTAVGVGEPLVYTIEVSNAGPSGAPDVAVDDTFPAGLIDCGWTSVAAGGATGNSSTTGVALADTLNLPAGSSVTYTVTCTVDESADGTTLSNTVSASSPTVLEPTPGDATATDGNTAVGSPVEIPTLDRLGLLLLMVGLALLGTWMLRTRRRRKPLPVPIRSNGRSGR